MASHDRERIRKAASALGALLVGRLVTRELLVQLARHAGVRLTAQQAAKFVPVAGQVVSASMSYAALRTLGELHIKDCVRVAHAVRHQLPPPTAAGPIGGGALDAGRSPSRVARAWHRWRPR
jgi:hypothetical protein